jgi:hypothetical protein
METMKDEEDGSRLEERKPRMALESLEIEYCTVESS